MTSINTSYGVIVLGDRETMARDDLAETAAGKGAVIAETYTFEPGCLMPHDDLTEVEEVVSALSRAIATGTDVWVPFPLPDLGREQHVRRISLVLQRHGLNMLMGRDLEPCALDGGFNEVDFALRAEVKAVDGLDHAVLASAGGAVLATEIEKALQGTAAATPAAPVTEPPPAEDVVVGERFYSTGEVARFFGKSTQWVYWGMRSGVFVHSDGAVIEPIRIGRGGRRRFTIPMLREMARACYRRGILAEDELLDLLGVLAREQGD